MLVGDGSGGKAAAEKSEIVAVTGSSVLLNGSRGVFAEDVSSGAVDCCDGGVW